MDATETAHPRGRRLPGCGPTTTFGYFADLLILFVTNSEHREKGLPLTSLDSSQITNHKSQYIFILIGVKLEVPTLGICLAR